MGRSQGRVRGTYLLYGANPTYGGHELPMTASSDQAWQKKTHSFNGLNMFESSSLMFFSFRHTLFSSQTCCWFAERPFSLGQVSHVVRQYSPCCWPLSPLPLLANIIWRIHLCWWTSPPKKHINPVNDTPHISQCPTKSYMTLATLAAHSTEWSAICRLSDGPAYNGGRT